MLRKPRGKVIGIAELDAPWIELRDKPDEVKDSDFFRDWLRAIKKSLLAALCLDRLRFLNCDSKRQLVLRVRSATLVWLDAVAQHVAAGV
jgi:hypothetical protein